MADEVSLYATRVASHDVVNHVIASMLRFVGPDSGVDSEVQIRASGALLEAVALREALDGDDPLDELFNDAGNRDDEDDEDEPEMDN